VYEGQIVGIHSRDNDLVVNVLKGKKLTNMRASGSDENVLLTPPIKHSLEQALEFIDDDELVEITPTSIRIRKKFLKEHERKRTVAACSSPAPQPSTGTTLATTPAIEARSALPALEDASLATLQGWLAEGRISSRDLVAFHLARIAALDRGEHGLHAVIEVNPGAMAIAELRDAERKAGQLRGPLHGSPGAGEGQHRDHRHRP
jgi:hypothetical protein